MRTRAATAAACGTCRPPKSSSRSPEGCSKKSAPTRCRACSCSTRPIALTRCAAPPCSSATPRQWCSRPTSPLTWQPCANASSTTSRPRWSMPSCSFRTPSRAWRRRCTKTRVWCCAPCPRPSRSSPDWFQPGNQWLRAEKKSLTGTSIFENDTGRITSLRFNLKRSVNTPRLGLRKTSSEPVLMLTTQYSGVGPAA